MKDKQVDSGLVRIRELLDASRGQDRAFVPNPRLSEGDLLAWEAQYGVSLPEEYRLFLLEIGDGGMMLGKHFGGYFDFEIYPLARVSGAPMAAQPFPLTVDRVWERLRNKARPDDGVLFPELTPYWEDEDVGRPPGCVGFGVYPSTDGLFLVTAGDLRGTVWCDVFDGVIEGKGDEFMGFLDWFADVLTEFEGGA
jgi:hypothetical protein